MSVGTYRLKSFDVQAIQWTGNNAEEIIALLGLGIFDPLEDGPCDDDPDATASILSSAHNTWVLMYTGNWIIIRENGYRFVLSDEAFREAYEPAGDEPHLVQFREDGWTIQHPLACRPNLFACDVNASGLDGPPDELGIYECAMRNGHLIVGKRVEAVAP